ncbi:MAG: hypothetical protein ACYC7D_05270 [Nitrososphaerales archaeon]
MKLKEGTRLSSRGWKTRSIVLRRVEVSQERARLRKLLSESRIKAEKSGFTEKEIENVIQSIRKDHQSAK